MPPRPLRALILLVLSLLPSATRAATPTWQGPPATPANWFDPANWSTNAVPTSTDAVQINNAGQPEISFGPAAASSLSLGTNPGDTGSLSLAGGQLTAPTAYVGNAGNGSVTQSGGTLTGSTLYLAYNSKSAGSYTLQNPATLSYTTEYLGYASTASFTQSGGFNSPTTLYLAGSPSSGSPSAASASYDLSGGQLTASTTYVGYAGNATLTQSGGNHRIASHLYLGYNANSSGTYNLLGNAFLSAGQDEYVGYNGAASFTQSAGVNSAPAIYVGGGTAPASYALSGTAQLSAATLSIGYASGSKASFTQTDGTTALSNTSGAAALYVAYAPNSTASYSLSGGFLSVSSSYGSSNVGIHVASGAGSSGTFTQSGGTHNTGTLPLFLADGTNSSAYYALSAGSLSTGTQYVGHTGTATFDQSGGINQASTLYLGYNSGSTAYYSLSNDAQLISSAQYHANGPSSHSTFTQTGGSNNLGTNPLYLAYGTSSTASYALSSGTLLSANQYLGYNGAATFTQSGGTNNLAAATLYLSYNSPATSSYSLSAGTLLAAKEYVGYNGPAAFTQSGGTNNLGAGTLYVGNTAAAAKGTYSLIGPDAVLVAATENIGSANAPSTFRQTAGSNTVATLTIAAGSRYELSGGSLLITSALSNAGTLDLAPAGNPVSLTVNLPFLDLTTKNILLNAPEVSLTSTSPNALLLLPAGLDPATSFASFSNAGITHVTGTPLVVPAGTSISIPPALPTLSDPVDVSGSLTGTALTLAGGAVTRSAGSLTASTLLVQGDTPSAATGSSRLTATSIFVGGTAAAPGSPGSLAISDTATVSASTITIQGDTPSTASGSSHLTAANLYVGGTSTAAGSPGTLTISNSATVTASSKLTIWSPGTVNLTAGTLATPSVVNNGTLNLTTGSLLTASILNNGTLNLAGGSLRRDSTGGTILDSITGTGSASLGAGLSVSATYVSQSSLSLAGTLHLYSPTTPSYLASLSMTTIGARLDLLNSTLTITPNDVTTSQADAIRHYIHNSQLYSAAADASHYLGFLVSPAAITLHLTRPGDANLDGKITADDYALLDRSFAAHNANAYWSDGDFNYDGTVDASDYLLIDTTYLSTHPTSPDFLAQRESQFGAGYVQELVASVPEPTSPMACLFAGLLFPRRRNQRKTHPFRR